MKMSRIVFLTGENIGADASETQHLYRRIVSFRKCSECNIAIISNGNMALPKNLHREHVVRMRDMSVGTGLLFLSMYHWLKDLIEE